MSSATGFAEFSGDPRAVALMEDAFSILSGREDGNTLDRLVIPGYDGLEYFVNDHVWWTYTDGQCNYHGTHGWRPFLPERLRQVDRDTWRIFFRRVVDDDLRRHFLNEEKSPIAPPVGYLPHSIDPKTDAISVTSFYSNVRSPLSALSASADDPWAEYETLGPMGTHDLNMDYPLLNILSAADWILWERDTGMAREVLPRIEAHLRALMDRQDESGFILGGPQASHVEFGHGGWRYASSTHNRLTQACASVAKLARLLGEHALAETWDQETADWVQKSFRFLTAGGWFIGHICREDQRPMGTGLLDGSRSDFLEVWMNTTDSTLEYVGSTLRRGILDRLRSVPFLVERHFGPSNWPERPEDEKDEDHHGFPPPGAHVNGGWFWMTAAGALKLLTVEEDPDLLDHLEALLDLHHRHLSIDYYNEWGADMESQWPDRRGQTHSITCAGAFGMLFRGMFDLWVDDDSLRITPHIPPSIDEIRTVWPIRWGGRDLFIRVRAGRGTIGAVLLNGRPYIGHDEATVRLLWEDLERENLVEIDK